MLRHFFLLLSLLFSFTTFAGPVRVVIFSAPFGNGHNGAANGIKQKVVEHYRAQGIEINPETDIIVKNTMDFAPADVSKRTQKWFVKLQNDFPKIYSWGFNFYLWMMEGLSLQTNPYPFHRQLKLNPKDLEHYMLHEAFKDADGKSLLPTAVFSTWPGSTEALIILKHETGLVFSDGKGKTHQIKIAHVQTDNGEERYFRLLAEGVDITFVPSKKVYEALIDAGVPAEKVILTGMPVPLGEELPDYETRELEKKSVRKKFGLDPERKTVLIEAGKNGGANYVGIIAATMLSMPNEPLNFITICGENAEQRALVDAFIRGAPRGSPEFKLLMKEMRELTQPINFRSFTKRFFDVFNLKPILTVAEAEAMIERGLPSHVKVLNEGFVRNLGEYRAGSDIVATKPGGVSTNEMGVRGFLMVIMLQYASGEALPNGPLFKSLNLATLSEDTTLIGKAISQILSNDGVRREMYEAAKEFRKDFNLERVLPFIDQAIERYQLNWTQSGVARPASICSKIFSAI